MGPGTAPFILMIVAMVMVTAIITTWIQARAPKKAEAGSRDEVEQLERENAELNARLIKHEERLAVLERIATDPAERTAREIEQLR
jgi:uncharacterized protein YlxW (UPF0749 family)